RPEVGVLFRRRQGAGDSAPAILDGLVDGGAVGALEAVLHVPDLLGNGGDLGHRPDVPWGNGEGWRGRSARPPSGPEVYERALFGSSCVSFFFLPCPAFALSLSI